MDLEHERRLAEVEARAKSNTHRLDKLEAVTEAIGRLAASMEVMAQKQERVAETVDKLDGKVTALEQKPVKRVNGMWPFKLQTHQATVKNSSQGRHLSTW